MAKNYRNKQSNIGAKNQHSSPKDSDYDLKQNLNKINQVSQGKRNNHSRSITQTGDEEIIQYPNNEYISGRQDISQQTYSGGVSREEYYRLDDKISNINSKNDEAHTDLRRELESKLKDSKDSLEANIDKKLSIQWYVWTIGALVAIATLFYILSYNNVHSLPEQVHHNQNRIDGIEKNINDIKTELNTKSSNNTKSNK